MDQLTQIVNWFKRILIKQFDKRLSQPTKVETLIDQGLVKVVT